MKAARGRTTFLVEKAGRVTALAGSFGGNNTNYATAIGYAPSGAFSSFTLGNSLARSFAYNSRLQPISMTDVANGTTQLGLTYGWGSTNNNGDLLSETNGDRLECTLPLRQRN